MLIVYSLIIILGFSVFGILMVDNYKDTRKKSMEIRLFQTANVVADTYKANMDDIIYARFMVKSYGQQADSRILVVDKDKKVLIDNYNSFIGKTLNNQEIRTSLKGESKSGVYEIEDKTVLHISVPIIMNDGLEFKVIGAVLISSSMDSLVQDVEDLKNTMFKIAISALIISLILTIIFANRITKPLRKLTYGVEKLSSGYLGFHIEEETDDEIGQLIQNFNSMSHMLNNIEQNRKTFINSISHELKTPLTSIKALIDSLSIGDNPLDTYKEYLKDIYSETERMEDLVNYLMTSIKLEDIVLDIKKHDIGSILEDTVKIMTPYAEKNGVEIILENTKNTMVLCDKNRVKEVFFNLIDNAIKYKDEKKGNNYVLITLNKFKDTIVISVKDNGLGIDRNNLSNIFQGGFRVLGKNINKGKNVEGYGIGLAIVNNILTKHNWTISVDSSLKLGSVFTITIPI